MALDSENTGYGFLVRFSIAPFALMLSKWDDRAILSRVWGDRRIKIERHPALVLFSPLVALGDIMAALYSIWHSLMLCGSRRCAEGLEMAQ